MYLSTSLTVAFRRGMRATSAASGVLRPSSTVSTSSRRAACTSGWRDSSYNDQDMVLDIWNSTRDWKICPPERSDGAQRCETYCVHSCKKQLGDVAVDSLHRELRLGQEIGKMAALPIFSAGSLLCFLQTLIDVTLCCRRRDFGAIRTAKVQQVNAKVSLKDAERHESVRSSLVSFSAKQVQFWCLSCGWTCNSKQGEAAYQSQTCCPSTDRRCSRVLGTAGAATSAWPWWEASLQTWCWWTGWIVLFLQGRLDPDNRFWIQTTRRKYLSKQEGTSDTVNTDHTTTLKLLRHNKAAQKYNLLQVKRKIEKTMQPEGFDERQHNFRIGWQIKYLSIVWGDSLLHFITLPDSFSSWRQNVSSNVRVH